MSMCAIVTLMCVGLVLLEAGATAGLVALKPTTLTRGPLLVDKDMDSSDCVHQCSLRCQRRFAGLPHPQLDTSCCNHSILCENSCRRVFEKEWRTESNLLESTYGQSGRELPSPSGPTRMSSTRGACELSASLWTQVESSCQTCRSKRKQRSPMLREAALIARSVGLDLGGLDATALGGRPFDVRKENTVAEVKMIQPVWKLRLESISCAEEHLVTTQVSWDSYTDASIWYLVTWEVEGGGLRGNLLTNSTSASLSMWPDMVYHVQVSSAGTADSECLVVNTHSPQSPSPSHPLYGLSQAETIAGATAAILLFLLLLLLLAGRTRLESLHSSKDVGLRQDFNCFKLYPPPITLSKDVTSKTGRGRPPQHSSQLPV